MDRTLKALSRTLYRLAEKRALTRTAKARTGFSLRKLVWALALVGGFLWLTLAAWDVHPVAGKAMAGVCTLLIAGQARKVDNDTDEYRADPMLRKVRE